MISKIRQSLQGLSRGASNRINAISPRRAIGSLAALTDKALAPASAPRVLLDRALPNLDRVLSNTSITGGKGGAHAAKVLSALTLSSLKGTRTVADDAARASLASRAGLRGGAGVGSLVGGGSGATAGWNSEGDPEGRLKRTLLGAAVGAGAGAGIGAPTGLYGTAGWRGLKGGTGHFATRMKAWDDLASMGVTPAVFDNRDVIEAAAKNFLGSKTIGDMRGNWGEMKGMLKHVIDQGDRAKVQNMGAGGRDAGSIFTSHFGSAMRNAGVREFNAGPIVNPDLAVAVLSPSKLEKLRSSIPSLERFYGTTAGNTTRYLGNPKAAGPEGARARLLADVVSRALKQSDGRPPEFVPRQSSGSLLQDLIRRKEQAPRDIPFRRATADNVHAYVDNLPRAVLKRLALEKGDVQKLVSRAKDEGNINIKRIWEDAGKRPVEERRFSFDMRKDILPQLKKNPQMGQIESDPSATWKRQLLAESKDFHPAGIREWKPSFNARQQRAVQSIQDRLKRGEKVNVGEETARALGVSVDELKEMFAKPVKPVKAPVPPAAAVEAPPAAAPKSTPETPQVSVPKPGVPEVGFRKGDVWELLAEDLKGGGKVSKSLPAWDKVEDVLGISKAELLADAGVRNADDWERFKRLLIQEVGKSDTMVKAASSTLSFPLRWRLRRLMRLAA
jgi:hypothetical protein